MVDLFHNILTYLNIHSLYNQKVDIPDLNLIFSYNYLHVIEDNFFYLLYMIILDNLNIPHLNFV